MASKVICSANVGTCHELVIFSEGDRFFVDNVSDWRGNKTWPEFPRVFKTVRGCKLSAAKIFGQAQVWTQGARP